MGILILSPGTIRHYVLPCRAASGHYAKLLAQAWHYGSLAVSCRADRHSDPPCPCWLVASGGAEELAKTCLKRRPAPPLSYSHVGEGVTAVATASCARLPCHCATTTVVTPCARLPRRRSHVWRTVQDVGSMKGSSLGSMRPLAKRARERCSAAQKSENEQGCVCTPSWGVRV